MASASEIVRYFRECYEADNRETGIANLLSRKYRHVFFLSGEDDLLRGLFDRVPVDHDRATAAWKDAQLYRKDRTLVLAAFPLVGAAPPGTRLPARLCAPLVFYPARIDEQDGVALLSVDLTEQRVNFPVLAALVGGAEASRSLAEELAAAIPEAPFRKEDIHLLISHLQDFLPQTEALELAEYPRLNAEQQVRRVMKTAAAAGQGLRCLSACALALIPNSPSTRGVLFELAEMADGRPPSTPVRLLFGPSAEPPREAPPRDSAGGRVPAVLSHAQRRVLDSALASPLTLVVGPPGTGKSYTIAALALDQLSRGRSVLVASRMNQAVDVVARKIEAIIGPLPCVIRGGRQQHLRQLKRFLRQILHGMTSSAPVEQGDVVRLERRLVGFDRRLARLERRLKARGHRENLWGTLRSAPAADGLLDSIVRAGKLRWLGWRLGAAPPLWELTRQYQAALQERSRLVAELLRTVVAGRLQSMLRHHRRELNKFSQAIRARTDLKQQRLFSEISLDVLFGTFPIWLVTLADVAEVLPLRTGLFDLAIIDEATQCDVASCLPVLQRARRAVVVGDPNQLRHVSFLSRQRQRAIGQRSGLDAAEQDLFQYREKSVLDLTGDAIATQQQVLFLDEHFRSMPQIIAFSNREFYSGSLKVMTERPETADLQCVRLCHVAGGRKTGGANEQEAQAIVEEVVRAVTAEEPLPADTCHSLGVLSPFRDQVDRISALLQKRLSWETIDKHELMVGTAHSFQGEERDRMYLSLVVDAGAHPASLQFLNNPNVFNVAITRARHEQYVFCSVRPEELLGDSLVRRYLASIAAGPRHGPAPRRAPPDVFLDAVREALHEQGYRTWPAYPVAGMEIDLVVERAGKTLGLDLIGYPGQFAAVVELERYRMLQRAGLWLLPLPYRAWCEGPAACLAAIGDWHARLLG